MTWLTYEQYNATDMSGLFLYPASIWAGFIPLLLFTIFIITLLGTYFSQKRQTQRADFLASFAVASWLTFIVAVLMSLVPGLMNIITLIIVLVIAIIAVAMYLLSNND